MPKPTVEDYVSARLLEALVEGGLALRFLNEGLVRDAVGRAFQAWRALLAALLRLELDKLVRVARTEEERSWLMNRAVPRVPTTRMKALSQLLEEIGYAGGIYFATSTALELHDYQYNGPDPDLALSKFRDRQEAATAVVNLIKELANRIENLKQRMKWSDELENALNELRRGGIK